MIAAKAGLGLASEREGELNSFVQFCRADLENPCLV